MAEPSQELLDAVEAPDTTQSTRSRGKKFARNREKAAEGQADYQQGRPLLCDLWGIPNKRRMQIGFVGLTFIVPFVSLTLVHPEWTGHIGMRMSLGLFSLFGQAALLMPLLVLYGVLSCSGFRLLRKTDSRFVLPLFLTLVLTAERWSGSGAWLGSILDRALVAALGPGGAWLMTGTLLCLVTAAFLPKAKNEVVQTVSIGIEHLHEMRLRLRNWWIQITTSSDEEEEEYEADVEPVAQTPAAPVVAPKTVVKEKADLPPTFFDHRSRAATPPQQEVAAASPLPESPTQEIPPANETVEEQSPTLEIPKPPEAPTIVKKPESEAPSENPNILRFADPEEIEDSLEISKSNLTKDEEAELAVPRARVFELPPLVLLDDVPYSERHTPTEDKSQALLDALDAFGVKAKLLQIVRGPTVTRYELQPARGVKVSKFTSLTNDIALALASTAVRIEAPIPGKSAIGIEIPNKHTDLVVLKDILRDSVFTQSKGLTVALGKDLSGRPVVTDLQKMPHLLVAGTTGSGKSVCVNGLIVSLLYRFTPDQLQLMMVDPKQVELSVYEDIPHLVGFSDGDKGEIIVDPKKAAQALHQVVGLMEERYRVFAENKVRNLAEYNKKFEDEQMPWFVVIIDELADLMMVASKSVETSICRIAQKARAAGIHLVLATQRPSADVITGLIKVNIPSRAAFAVSSQVDSRVILDSGGAEHLLGKGDMLFLPVDASDPKRLQGSYVGNEEIARVVEFWKGQGLPDNRIEFDYEEDILAEDDDSDDDDSDDALIQEALRAMLERKQASASMLQTQLKVGYARARRLLIAMEKKGWVGPPEGSKPRKILYSGPPPGADGDGSDK